MPSFDYLKNQYSPNTAPPVVQGGASINHYSNMTGTERLGKHYLWYASITDIGDMVLWIGSAWYVTTSASPGFGITVLLFVTGIIRIAVSLFAGISKIISDNTKLATNVAAILYIVGVSSLFFVVALENSYLWLIAAEGFRALAISVLRVVRESWLKALTECDDSNNYSGKVMAISHSVRVVAPAAAGLVIAAISFEYVCLVMVVQSVVIGILTYFLSERIHAHQSTGRRNSSDKFSWRSLDPIVVDLTLLTFFVNAAIAPLGVYLPTVIKYSYEAGVTQFGIGEGLLGMGAVLGSLLGRRIVRLGKNWPKSLAVSQLIIYIGLVISADIVELYVYLAALGLTVGAMQAGALSMYLEKIPKEEYIRIRSVQMASAGLAYPAGISIAGMLVSIYPPHVVPVFQALIMGFAVVLSFIYCRNKHSNTIFMEE